MMSSGIGSGLSIGKEYRTVSAATWASSVVTLTTSAAHGLAVGTRIRVVNIAGSTTNYNGVFVTTTGTTGSTIKYAKTSDPGTSTIVATAGPTQSGVYSIGMTTTPTKILNLLPGETLGVKVDKIKNPTLAGGTIMQPAAGTRQAGRKAGGDTPLLLWNHGETALFEAMLGGYSVAGPSSSLYTHTFSPARYLPSYTTQVSLSDVTATMVKQQVGAMVESWEMKCAAGENVTLGLTWVAVDQSISTGAALSGSLPSNLFNYNYLDGTITVAGASPGCVKSITFSGNNNLDSDGRCVGRATIQDPERADFGAVTGEITFDFDPADSSYVTDYIAGTQKTVVLLLSRDVGSAVLHTVTITATVQWSEDPTPKVSDLGRLTVTTPFEAFLTAGNTDAQTFSIVAVNGDAVA